MRLSLLGLVLLAALCHATWNAFVKVTGDRLAGLAAISLTSTAAGLLMAPLVPPPNATGGLLLAASVLVHMLYKLLLPLAYEKGILTLVYPVLRGVAPLTV